MSTETWQASSIFKEDNFNQKHPVSAGRVLFLAGLQKAFNRHLQKKAGMALFLSGKLRMIARKNVKIS